MSQRTRCLMVVVMLDFLARGCIASAFAWDGTNRFGVARTPPTVSTTPMTRARLGTNNVMPRAIAGHAGIQPDLRIHHRARLQSRPTIAVWPYPSFVTTTPTDFPPTQGDSP